MSAYQIIAASQENVTEQAQESTLFIIQGQDKLALLDGQSKKCNKVIDIPGCKRFIAYLQGESLRVVGISKAGGVVKLIESSLEFNQ